MLFDKIERQQREAVASPSSMLFREKFPFNHQKRLPKISQNASHIQNHSISHVLSPKSGRQNSVIHAGEKSFNYYEDVSSLRAPKVTAKNLPEVFHTSSQGGRRLKKITAAIKEKLVYVKMFEKTPNENFVESISHRPKLSAQQSRSGSQSNISPVRPSCLKKRNSAFCNNEYGESSSFVDPKSHRNRLQSATPTPFLQEITEITISPKAEYYGLDPPKLKIASRNASERSSAVNAFSNTPHPVPPSLPDFKPTTAEEINKQIRKLFIMKKIMSKSKSPESEMEAAKKNQAQLKPFDLKESFPTPTLQLNELITIKKTKTTTTNGVVKRMLHSPSFRLYDIQEEPILEFKSQETHQLKDWLNSWKHNFQKSKHLARVYSCFWNYPEGCVSVLLEPAKKGYLSDLLHKYGSLPENCIHTLAKELLDGIIEVHDKVNRIHGNICPSEIMIDSKGSIKLGPGISHQQGIIAKISESAANKEEKFFTPNPTKKATAVNYAQDVFDLGLTLLTCAIGDFNSMDLNGSLTPENIKLALDSMMVKKNRGSACCLLHSEGIIKKALGFITNSANNFLRKSVLKNNFSVKHNTMRESVQNRLHNTISIFDLLTTCHRFSDSFIDFLCSCLKLDPSQRPDPKALLNHEFLSDNHHSLGPLVTLNDIVKIQDVDVNVITEYTAQMSNAQVDKFCEALHVVFLNKEVRQKFDMISSRNPIKNAEDRKIVEVANEIDVPPHLLWEKLVQTVFPKV